MARTLNKSIHAVGDKIASGSHSITWNVLEEFEELRGDKIMFQVRAVGDNIETVMIGAQEWTTKNLDVSKYRNGDIIPEVKDNNEWYDLTTGAWCYYNNDPKNGGIYGKLYNWYAVNDPRGLAPEGFHVPSIAEWDILTANLGDRTSAGGKMKEAGTLHWPFPNTYATNRIGFTGIPGRSRYGGGKFDDDAGGISSYWWSSSAYDSRDWGYKHNLAYELDLWSRDNYARQNAVGKGSGLSVRCIRD